MQTNDADRDNRNQLYPYWWVYEGYVYTSENHKPFYRVVCRDEEERQLAIRVKPDCVRAEVILAGA